MRKYTQRLANTKLSTCHKSINFAMNDWNIHKLRNGASKWAARVDLETIEAQQRSLSKRVASWATPLFVRRPRDLKCLSGQWRRSASSRCPRMSKKISMIESPNSPPKTHSFAPTPCLIELIVMYRNRTIDLIRDAKEQLVKLLNDYNSEHESTNPLTMEEVHTQYNSNKAQRLTRDKVTRFCC